MRKKWIAAGIGMIMAVSLTGCSGKLSNDYVTINQYKGLEVSKVEKTEVTDEMVENTINSYLTADQTKTEIGKLACQRAVLIVAIRRAKRAEENAEHLARLRQRVVQVGDSASEASRRKMRSI